MKQIFKNVVKGLKQVGVETIEQGAKESVKIAESVITGKELLGGITPMSESEYDQKKKYQEAKDNKEMEEIRNQMKAPGRNVSGEMEQVYREKKNKEEEEERQFLENLKIQREQERQEMEAMKVEPGSKPARGKMGGQGKKKKSSEPDLELSQVTQTGEARGKME